MNQENLENKVEKLFREQGFEVKKEGLNVFSAVKKDLKFALYVFSSKEYSITDLKNHDFGNDKDIKVFIDEGLKELKNNFEYEISVISGNSEQNKDFDLPSYELIGEIALINDLQDFDPEYVVEGIRHYHPSVKAILVKEDSLKGEFRVGDYDVIYGSNTETTHKEFGCRFRLDPTKVYFSERFGTERDEVTDEIVEGEKVLVMFAGVGPFAVLSAKKGAEKVFAVEKNPIACDYLEGNIVLNNVEDIVEDFCGDVEKVLPKFDCSFDRIMMPLPGSSMDFLSLANDCVAEGGIIHLYVFVENEEFDTVEKDIEQVYSDQGTKYEIVGRSQCGVASPSKDRYRFDLKIIK